MSDGPLYEHIGRTYTATRREDPRVAAHIFDAIGDAASVVNVGAGAGSYEPPDRMVVAVDPSPVMLAQRHGRSRLVVQGVAENLPFVVGSFDVALAVLTIHHWADVDRGLSELRRVARRQVVFYFERTETAQFWGLQYFPEAAQVPTEQDAPGQQTLARLLDVREVRAVPVPHDCIDGFGAAFWRRPEAYTDPAVQAGMSWLAVLPRDVIDRGVARLRADLASGEWDRRFGHLRALDEYDAGYRVAVAGEDVGRR